MIIKKIYNLIFNRNQSLNLKFLALLFFVFLAKIIFAQNDSLLFFQSNSYRVQMWHPNEFKTHGIKSREIYNYKMNVLGRLLNKKALLFSQYYDEAQNKTFGVMFSEYTYHEKYHIYYQTYEIYFDSLGNTIKQISEDLEKYPELKGDVKIFSFKVNETDLTYDSLNRLSLRIDITRDFDFKVNVNSNDTIDFKVKEAKVFSRYLYSSENKLLRKYSTVDSSMIFLSDIGILDSIFISDCNKKDSQRSKYKLLEKWSYDKNGNLSEWISYLNIDKNKRKRSYLYDNNSKITQRVDSIAEWPSKILEKDFSQSYEYNETGSIILLTIKITHQNAHGVRTDTTIFSSDGNLITYYKLGSDGSHYKDYHIIYKDNNQKLKKFIYKYKGKLSAKYKYYYNKQGLISKSTFHLKKRKNTMSDYYNSKIKYVYE